MIHSAYEINQYVIFKYQEEWQEGRIVDIVVSDSSEKDNRTYYKVLSLSTLLEVPTLLYDHILQNNSDNIKKIKVGFEKIPVSKELRALIEEDKAMASTNKVYRTDVHLGIVFEDFSAFLISNKLYLSKEEILLSTEGLKHIFNDLVEKVLLTVKEVKYFDSIKRKEDGSYYTKFGIVYGIRVAYYVLKDFLEKMNDPEVRFLLFEFIVYFLDFCGLNLSKYYNKKYYE
ncbi:hypothetical protein NGRA_3501 [Nosema granulosis]|uniref:MRG domain-containing protein n=1 Tax=Nosema granulosis TaxID=83296 RepID=A0A9P6GV43_9MICR|nr:hypothetical protein NGRA_3501 [Nosema granulosis]